MLDSVRGTNLAEEIRAEIVSNQIQLPTLPEVALKVRDAVE
jgi:HD-like signal output (HDOD) protein